VKETKETDIRTKNENRLKEEENKMKRDRKIRSFGKNESPTFL
jgi:hypothetical protein